MSFSAELKNELCNVNISNAEQAYYELLGIILFSKNVNSNAFSITSDNQLFILRIMNLFKISKVTNCKYIKYREKKYRKKIRYFIDISNPEFINKINFNNYDYHSLVNIKSPFFPDFIRGIFLSCGNISNPLSNYHLEFIVYNPDTVNVLMSFLLSIKNFKLNPNHTIRRNTNIIYVKESEAIVDLLTYMGASKTSMNFIQTKMVHELRNYVNRTNNFETANISKTSKASSIQINAINKIKRTVGLNTLPNNLKEIAVLRLSNPYMSLNELSNCLSEPLSRSGINHRLRKIVDIALKIK